MLFFFVEEEEKKTMNKRDREGDHVDDSDVPMKRKDSSFIVENYRITLLGVEQIAKAPGVFVEPGDIIIHAILKIQLINTSIVEYVKTVFLIKNNTTQSFAETTTDLGLKIQLMNIDPKKNLLTFEASTSQRDYIILKIVEKPLINILWFGTLCMIAGFIITISKKYLESKNLRINT